MIANLIDIINADEAIDTWLLLRLAKDTIHKARRQELLQYGLTPETSAVLHIIQDLGGSAKPMEISRWTSRKLHSVHGLLERMENAGLVSKIADSERKNGVRVTLTDHGHDLYLQTSQLLGQRRIISSLTDKQREQFREILRILLDAARSELGEEGEVVLRPPI